MIKHQYYFDIEIPEIVVSSERHDKIFNNLMDNKVILGLSGYSKSGKDSVANKLISDYDFQRVAFADNLKLDMNKHLKRKVFDYLLTVDDSDKFHEDIHGGVILEDNRVLSLDMIDFTTEDIPIKERLRPFIIWYGEKLREINGQCYWINKALEIDCKGYDRIVFSDVRREKELDIFKESNTFINRTVNMFAAAGCLDSTPSMEAKSYSTLLFHVNQLGLTDGDTLTHECIRIAQENWMFDDVIYIDPRLPEKGKHRKKAIEHQLVGIIKKFGISKPDKFLNYPGKQLSLLD